MEVRLLHRLAKVNLLSREGNVAKFMVDGRTYELDIVQVEQGVYSVLYNGKSYNLELIPDGSPKKYLVNTLFQSYEAEIVDAETKYKEAIDKQAFGEGSNRIVAPMPGKVVRIPATIGEEVKAGQTVIVISAMKMESEFKASTDGKVKEIFVREGDVVDGNQTLMIIE